MKDRSGQWIVIVMATVLLVTTVFFQQVSSQGTGATGGVKPPKPNKPIVELLHSGESLGDFAVNAFTYLNWPAAPEMRGQPNYPVAKIGAGPAVWETYKNSTELYRPQGAVPPNWSTVCELPDSFPVMTVAQLQAQFGQTNSTWIHFLPESRMIDGQQIVDANQAVIRYDVRCSQDHFNYVANNSSNYQLFNVEGQQQAWADPNFTFNFPANSVEVKAAWRVLNQTDDDSHYWTAYGAYYGDNGQPAYAKIGLTAFHFIVRTPLQWIYFTYEQVDNPTATFQYFLQDQGDAVGTNSTTNPDAAKYNKKLFAQTQGTKWQYYQIIGWQDSETDANGNPVILANSNIETYFPATSSCMSCHAMANIGPPNNHRLNFWHTDRKGIRGRVGEIDFNAIAKQLDPNGTYKQTNYVWSLRQAQSTQAPSAKPKSRPAVKQ